MEAPAHIVEGLKNIRSGMHLRWNPQAVVVRAGSFDATGKPRVAEYAPRWELWDVDPDGREYRIMRLQNIDGSFRPPGEWLLEHVGFLNPERFGGRLDRMLDACIDEPEHLREIGTQKDSDDLLDAVEKWVKWNATPHSGAAIQFRGQRLPAGWSP